MPLIGRPYRAEDAEGAHGKGKQDAAHAFDKGKPSNAVVDMAAVFGFAPCLLDNEVHNIGAELLQSFQSGDIQNRAVGLVV